MNISHPELVSALANVRLVLSFLQQSFDQAIYRKELDRENVIEELGDLEFYLEGIRQGLGLTREECLEHNIRKLSKRYEGLKYSDKAAQDRADKA